MLRLPDRRDAHLIRLGMGRIKRPDQARLSFQGQFPPLQILHSLPGAVDAPVHAQAAFLQAKDQAFSSPAKQSVV